MLRLFYMILFLVFCHQAKAWEDHAMLTRIVLNDWSDKDSSMSAYLNQAVKLESLESFLTTTKTTLPGTLLQIEQWARKNEQGYQALPDELVYQPLQSGCENNIVKCFMASLRINPDVPLNYIVYDPGYYYSQQQGFARLIDSGQILPSYIPVTFNISDFALIPENGLVKISDIISTGSMQPDFGWDTFLYEDSGTSFGKLYGFGKQPIGNPALPFNSQMLFHMSAYHEDPVILTLIPRLQENYPEYRAYLYLNLSRFAAETNHPYWAAVFLGWGLHYIQDMTQPYHGKIAYGLDTNAVLYALSQMAAGNYISFIELQTLQTNRHIIIENLVRTIAGSSVDAGLYQGIILNQGLLDLDADVRMTQCNLDTLYVRNQVSRMTATTTSPDYQSVLQENLPSSYIDDPSFHAETIRDYDALFSQEMTALQRRQFSEAMALPMQWFGANTRNCIREIIPVIFRASS